MRTRHSYRKEIADFGGGGGGGGGGSGATYFYLVVDGTDKTVSVDHIQDFFKAGASSDERAFLSSSTSLPTSGWKKI